MKKLLLSAISVLVMVLLASGLVYARKPSKNLVFKLGHPLPPSMPMAIGASWFAEYVTEKTGGAVKIQVYPMSQLGGERAMFDQILSGTLDIGCISPTIMATAIRELDVFTLPFLLPNRDFAVRLMNSRELYDRLAPIMRAKGVEPLVFGFGVIGRGVGNKVRPIKKPEDFKGLKLRVMEGSIYTETFRALGANPAAIPWPEVYPALQQGVVDGEDSGHIAGVVMKFSEICKFSTTLNQTMQTNPIIVAKPSWDKLTNEQQQIFREGATRAVGVAQEETDKFAAKMLGIAKEKFGVEIVDELTPEEQAAFKEATEPVRAKHRTRIGQDFVDFYVELISKYSQK